MHRPEPGLQPDPVHLPERCHRHRKEFPPPHRQGLPPEQLSLHQGRPPPDRRSRCLQDLRPRLHLRKPLPRLLRLYRRILFPLLQPSLPHRLPRQDLFRTGSPLTMYQRLPPNCPGLTRRPALHNLQADRQQSLPRCPGQIRPPALQLLSFHRCRRLLQSLQRKNPDLCHFPRRTRQSLLQGNKQKKTGSLTAQQQPIVFVSFPSSYFFKKLCCKTERRGMLFSPVLKAPVILHRFRLCENASGCRSYERHGR